MNKEKNSNKCPICGRPTHKESEYCIFHASAEEKTEEEFKIAFKEYIKEIKKSKNEKYDFIKFIFIGEIYFKTNFGIVNFKDVSFRGATFRGKVDFEGVTFKEEAYFLETKFRRSANFKGVTFEREASFLKANFEEEADFDEVTFVENSSFQEVRFKGEVSFIGIDFKGGNLFFRAKFEREASFRGTVFRGNANFDMVTFKGEASFRGAIFKGEASFNRVTFKDEISFWEVTFQEEAIFWGAIFKEEAYFMGTKFRGNANFNETNFERESVFREVTFVKEVNFQGAFLPPGKLFSLEVERGGSISFEETYLESVLLKLNIDKDVLINLNGAKLRNTKIEKKDIIGHLLHEQKKEFSQAQEVYKILKNNFRSIGNYQEERWAFFKEKDMERKSYFRFKSLHKWLWSCFLNATYGYGEKPERVFLSAILIILIYAFIFMNYGIISDVQLNTLPKYNILKELFEGIRYGDLSIVFKNIPWEQTKNCLYFSTVTFTTLGLGDLVPVETWGRIFVGSEAFIGAFMMALFVYTFARRTGGR